MLAPAPRWLALHHASLRAMPDQVSWAVLFGSEPEYRLQSLPAGGGFTCLIVRTVSGRRLDRGGIYASAEDALHGGLEELRQVLGW